MQTVYTYAYIHYTFIYTHIQHVPVQVPILSRLYPHINTYAPYAFNTKQFQSRVTNMISQLHPAFVGYVKI